MIFFPELKAAATCEAPECAAMAPVALILTASGGFGGGAEGWQFLSDGAVFHSFCPDHHQELPKRPLIKPGYQPGPAGLRPINGRRG